MPSGQETATSFVASAVYGVAATCRVTSTVAAAAAGPVSPTWTISPAPTTTTACTATRRHVIRATVQLNPLDTMFGYLQVGEWGRPCGQPQVRWAVRRIPGGKIHFYG